MSRLQLHRGLMIALGCCCCSAAMALANTPVIVHQVEAFQPGTGRYATIDFGGSTTVTPGAGTYMGFTFHALDGTTTTDSGHAQNVAGVFYGGGSPTYPSEVTNVYSDSAGNYLDNTLYEASTGWGLTPYYFGRSSGGANGTAPIGIKVSNHSYIDRAEGGLAITHENPTIFTATQSTDEDIQRRIDFQIARENVVFCAAAVTDDFTPSSGVYKASLVWTAHNAMAVAGDFSGQPFFPNNTFVGKRHADIWQFNPASFATGVVSGDATALVYQAQSVGSGNGTQDEVIRSLLMTGADKSAAAVSTVAGTWTVDRPNNINTRMGAGRVDYTKSSIILNAGEQTTSAVAGGAITGATATTATDGWSYDTSIVGGRRAIVIQVPNGQQINKLVATLNWDYTYPEGLHQFTISGPFEDSINTADGSLIADLNLHFAALTKIGSTFIVGSDFTASGLKSETTDDNIEALYNTSAITPGYYAFLIDGDPSISVPFGFSFDLQLGVLTPEPGCASLLAVVACFASSRRRRR